MRSLFALLLAFFYTSTTIAAGFSGIPTQTPAAQPLWCDQSVQAPALVWTFITGSGTVTNIPTIAAAYPDGTNAVGVYRHTISADVERVVGSTSTTTGLINWDGTQQIRYVFGAKLISGFNISGAEVTAGLINRISTNRTGVSVRWETSSSTTQLFFSTSDGASETKTFLSAVDVNPFTWHRFEIVLSKNPRTATLIVDGVQRASTTLTLPSTSTPISPSVRSARYSATDTYTSDHDYACVYVQ